MLRGGSALLVVAAAGLFPNAALANCVLSPALPATVTCAPGEYETIQYQQDDLTIALNGAVIIVSQDDTGLSNEYRTINSLYQEISLGSGGAEISALGFGNGGIEMVGYNGDLFLRGKALVSTGGDFAAAIEMRTLGNANIDFVGQILTGGIISPGVEVEAGGNINAAISADIFTTGGASPAIYLTRKDEDDEASIDVTYDGTISVLGGSGDITAVFLGKQPVDDLSDATRPLGVNMALAAADPDEKQPIIVPAIGIYAQNSFGDINAVLDGQLLVGEAVNEAEQGPIGVYLNAIHGDIGILGGIDVGVQGNGAIGIWAKADDGDVEIEHSGNIFVLGNEATGVLVDGDEIDARFSGDIFADGEGSIGILARGDDVYVENSGNVGGGNGDDARGIKVLGDSYAELYTDGLVVSGNGYAVEVASENGEAYLTNDGVIIGEVDVFGETGGWFYNNGTFAASGYSSVKNWLYNDGIIQVSAATEPGEASIELDALVSNSGVISLVNDEIDDELRITETYDGKGGIFALDAELQDGDESDYIVLNAEVLGLTTIQVNNLVKAVTVKDGTFVSLIETKDNALENFTLAGGIIQTGFSDWRLGGFDHDDHFHIGVEATTSQARIADMQNVAAAGFDVFAMTAPNAGAAPGSGFAAGQHLGYVEKEKTKFPIEVVGASTNNANAKGPRLVAYGYGDATDITRKNNDGIRGASFSSGIDLISKDVGVAGDQFSFGVFASYASGKIAYAGGSSGTSQVTALGIKARYDWDSSFVASSVRIGFGENEYLVGGAKGDANTTTYGSTLDIGHRFKMPDGFYLEPSANLTVTRLSSGKANVGGTIVDADALSVNYGGTLKAGLQNITESGWTLDTFASAGVNFETIKGQTLVGLVSVAAAGRDPVYTLGGGFAATSPDGNFIAKISGAGFTGGQKGFSIGGSLHFKLGE